MSVECEKDAFPEVFSPQKVSTLKCNGSTVTGSNKLTVTNASAVIGCHSSAVTSCHNFLELNQNEKLSDQLIAQVCKLTSENDLWRAEDKQKLSARLLEIHCEEAQKLSNARKETNTVGDGRRQIMLKLQADADVQLLNTVNCRRMMPTKCCDQLTNQLINKYTYYKWVVKSEKCSCSVGLSKKSLISKPVWKKTIAQMKKLKASLQRTLKEAEDLVENKKVVTCAERSLLFHGRLMSVNPTDGCMTKMDTLSVDNVPTLDLIDKTFTDRNNRLASTIAARNVGYVL